MVSFLESDNGRIAYNKTIGEGIGVVFLSGFKSDMEGTKALFLQEWAKANGRPYLRFDYTGHGQSSGEFMDGCIGDWANDAMVAIKSLTEGPQILVGSSMGGWIALLVAREIPEKIAGLVGIAAAPDFTEDSMWANFNTEQRDMINKNGQIDLPSEYSDEPYVITRKLIEDGRSQLVLHSQLNLPFPVRLLQGTEDVDVDQSVALRLLDHVFCDNIHLTLVKGADHSFSSPDCLRMIETAIEEAFS